MHSSYSSNVLCHMHTIDINVCSSVTYNGEGGGERKERREKEEEEEGEDGGDGEKER